MLSSIPGLQTPDCWRRKFEKHLLQNLGYEVATFVRSIGEVERIAGAQPFSAAELKTQTATRFTSDFYQSRPQTNRDASSSMCGNKSNAFAFTIAKCFGCAGSSLARRIFQAADWRRF